VQSKINKNISDGFWYTFGEILNKVSVFLLIPFYTTFFTKEQYGLLSIVIIITTFSNHIISYATKSAFLRLIYDYTEEDRKKLVFTIIVNLVIILLIVLLLTILFHSISLVNDFSFLSFFKYIYVILLYSLFFSITNVALNILRVKRKVKYFTFYNLFKTLLEIGFIIFFVKYLSDGVFGKVLGSFITMLLLSVILYFLIIKNNIIFQYEKRISKKCLKFATPLVINNILGWTLVSYDQMLFENNYGLKEFAILSFALQICSIYKFSMEGVLRAFNVYLYEKMNKIKKDIQDFFVLFVSMFSFAAVLLLVFEEQIILTISTSDYLSAAKVIDYYIVSRFLMLVNALIVFLLLVNKNSKEITKSTMLSVVSMLIFSTYLIPKFGMSGAALSATITFFVRNLYLSFKLNKSMRFYSFKSAVVIAVFLLVVFSKLTIEFTFIYKLFSVMLVAVTAFLLNRGMFKKIFT
jgi:O-antigen/teichoic acid export membrane protein